MLMLCDCVMFMDVHGKGNREVHEHPWHTFMFTLAASCTHNFAAATFAAAASHITFNCG